MAFKDRFPALASRDFFIFWVGQFISLIGTWMQNTTQPYLAYRITGSSFDLGLIAFSATLPTLILALPGGVLIERMDKRKIVIVMQVIEMVQAFFLAFLALTGRIQIWHLIWLSFVLGAASAIEITARQAMLIELVGKPALPNAIALQSTIFNLARVIGPSLTAIVLVLIKNQGEGWAFFANGVSFLFVIVGLFFVRTPYRVVKPEPVHGKAGYHCRIQAGLGIYSRQHGRPAYHHPGCVDRFLRFSLQQPDPGPRPGCAPTGCRYGSVGCRTYRRPLPGAGRRGIDCRRCSSLLSAHCAAKGC